MAGHNLHGHSVDDQLHSKVSTIGRNFVLEFRARSGVIAVLIDQVPQHFVENGSPDLADGVNFVLLVRFFVIMRVSLQVGGVRVVTDALAVANPCALE